MIGCRQRTGIACVVASLLCLSARGELPAPGLGSVLINPDAPEGPLFMLGVNNGSGGAGYVGYDVYHMTPVISLGRFDAGERRGEFAAMPAGPTDWTLRKYVRDRETDPWQRYDGTHCLSLIRTPLLTQVSFSAANNHMGVTNRHAGVAPTLWLAADVHGTAVLTLDAAWSNGCLGVGGAVLWRITDFTGGVFAAGDFLHQPSAVSLSSCAGKQILALSGVDRNASGGLDEDEWEFDIVLNVLGLDIRAQGLDTNAVTIPSSEPLLLTLDLIAGAGAGYGADWWCLGHDLSSDQWFYYVSPYSDGTSWAPWTGGVCYQQPLHDLPGHRALDEARLSPGTYEFYFGVDLRRNGVMDFDCLVYDEVVVTVTP